MLVAEPGQRLVHRHARPAGIGEDDLDAVPDQGLDQDVGPGHGLCRVVVGLALVDGGHFGNPSGRVSPGKMKCAERRMQVGYCMRSPPRPTTSARGGFAGSPVGRAEAEADLMPEWAEAIAADGFAILPAIVAPGVLAGVLADLGGSPHAIRDLIAAVPSGSGGSPAAPRCEGWPNPPSVPGRLSPWAAVQQDGGFELESGLGIRT